MPVCMVATGTLALRVATFASLATRSGWSVTSILLATGRLDASSSHELTSGPKSIEQQNKKFKLLIQPSMPFFE